MPGIKIISAHLPAVIAHHPAATETSSELAPKFAELVANAEHNG